MAGLRLRLERRGALLLNFGDVLSTERVPAKPQKAKAQPRGCRANVILENFAVVEWFTALLENIVLRFGVWSLQLTIIFDQFAQRKTPLRVTAFRHIGVAAVESFPDKD